MSLRRAARKDDPTEVERLEFSAPIQTVSEANQREHWAKKNKRKKAQQAEIDAEFLKALKRRRIALPCLVRLTRYGPRALDSDNLAGAFKGIRDSIAARIGVDDGSDLIKFEYDQVPIRERSYAVKVEISVRG